MTLLAKLADQGRKQFREGAGIRGKKLYFLALYVVVFVGIVDLLKAYKMHSGLEVCVVAITWLIVISALAFCWFRRKPL
jgi:hypothetical protein